MVKARARGTDKEPPLHAEVFLPDGTSVLLRSDYVQLAHVHGVILSKLSDNERRAFDVLLKLEEMNQVARAEAGKTQLVSVGSGPVERAFFRGGKLDG